MRRFLLLAGPIALLGATQLSGQMSPQHLEPVAGGVDSTTQAQEIGIKPDETDRMTVQVDVAGAGPFNFLVDTGAERTAISHQLARHLKLPSGPTARVHSISGANPIRTARIPGLGLSQKRIGSIDAPMFDARNLGADGMLGVDSLRSQRVQFDFGKGTMTIVPSAQKRERDTPDTIVVRARLRNGRLVMTEARVEGRPAAAVIDTGSQITIGNPALRAALSRSSVTSIRPVLIESVTGDTLMAEYTIIKELKLGDVTLTDLAVAFADAHTFRQLGYVRQPALLLGMNAMRAFDRVSIDFASRKLRMHPRKDSAVEDVRLAAR
ncbi:retroviral-like aspartic protease family protein [Sphingomonas sp. GCM10030256]|uniref:retroviral-like aspartic protease family protein n=1 Tax=Sphingomonas sp. GCM10030256 TaxID=3273427 RepID=UPI00361A0717